MAACTRPAQIQGKCTTIAEMGKWTWFLPLATYLLTAGICLKRKKLFFHRNHTRCVHCSQRQTPFPAFDGQHKMNFYGILSTFCVITLSPSPSPCLSLSHLFLEIFFCMWKKKKGHEIGWMWMWGESWRNEERLDWSECSAHSLKLLWTRDMAPLYMIGSCLLNSYHFSFLTPSILVTCKISVYSFYLQPFLIYSTVVQSHKHLCLFTVVIQNLYWGHWMSLKVLGTFTLSAAGCMHSGQLRIQSNTKL